MTLNYDRAYQSACPSDMRELQHTTDVSIINFLTMRGHRFSPELGSIQPLVERIKLSTCTMESSGFKVVEGSIRAGRKALLHHFSRGFDKWAAFVERFDKVDEQNRAFRIANHPGTTAKWSLAFPYELGHAAEKEYARWWKPNNEPTLASLLRGPLRCSCHSGEDGCMQLGPGLAMLYACCWCSCRSAVVRKCSGCQSAWYCDVQCQRAHWPKHRLVCRYRE
ncbi:hypothetical protein C8T65DRAFT_26271 [Cerioporus squamosus]|nr:hypothetical protein C8T65DRAFT_26271 [Cerioporus squamosus]